MGRRVNKKSRALQKEKQVVATSHKTVSEQSNLSVDMVDDSVTVPKERKTCPHLGNSLNLNNFSEKLGSSDPFRCKDCREGVADRRGMKGKGKHGKKKGNASVDSKSESKAIWICLECGHYACGGVGLPTTPQSHSVHHARQTRHPLVIQLENPHLCWCFQCNTLLPVEKLEENGENKDALSNVVKLIKTRSSKQSVVDVEDAWFGGGSAATEIKASEVTRSCVLEGNGGYLVKGLVNLGNTCFFNSVMQNLLAINKLRDYLLKQDASFGPLSISLKKIFAETKLETGLKNEINPKSLFGSLCSKAPQFRGYQQQDSHELLRYLLDRLSMEELAARKQSNASGENGISPKQCPTFVEATFGGRISSTVCCVECGHSSTVYEPFLDLSLSVPTKKPPLKKGQPASRSKKTKLAPKRGGRVRPKASKNTDHMPAEGISNPSASGESTLPLVENAVASSSDTTISGCTSSLTLAVEGEIVSQSSSAVPKPEKEWVVEEVALEQPTDAFDSSEFSWMDYIDQTTSDIPNLTSQNNDVSITQDSMDKNMDSNDGLKESTQVCPESCSVNPWEEEVPLQLQGSEVLLLPYKEESYSNGDSTRGKSDFSPPVEDCGQEEVDYVGLGDLFDEPEVSAEPLARPSLGNDVAEIGFMAGNSSESDPDEVDNADSPVSIQSCLVHFVKPELLCNDNAWECENCSKILQRQTLEAKKQQAKTESRSLINEGETQIRCDPPNLHTKTSCTTEVGKVGNRDTFTSTFLNAKGESLVSDNGKIDISNEICVQNESDKTSELNPSISPSEEQKGLVNDTLLKQSHSSGECDSYNRGSSSGPVGDSCVNEHGSTGLSMTIEQRGENQSSGNNESAENEDEEKIPKKLKVKREATKRVLIDKAPPILTIHLKRFSQDARGRLSKLNGHVNFGDMLDLRPYVDPRCVDTEKCVYRLLGVVEHMGTMRGGHYVAYVRGGKKSKDTTQEENKDCVWYHVSDAYVREASLEEVLRSEAYILFFEKP